MVQKILLSQDPELLPKTTKRKTLTIPLRAGNNWWDSTHRWDADHISVQPYLVINEVRFTLLSSHILGAPQLDSGQAKFSGHRARQTRKAIAVPERKRINNQWVPESRFTNHNSQI